MPPTSRQHIISALHRALEPLDHVLALWLEGADATGTVDEWSDIDFWLDVRDGEEDGAFDAAESVLAGLRDIDFSFRMPLNVAVIRHRVYHLRDTPEFLLIDVVVQSHSRDFTFVRGHDTEKPLVLFDKADVIQFRDPSPEEIQSEIAARLARIDGFFAQRSRVISKVERGHFLEALAYYRRFVLEPLVELLRLQHAPHKSDYGLKHIHRDLLPDIVRKLETLHSVTSCEDIGSRMAAAAAMFNAERSRFSEPPTS
jgi:hypothetical protein